MTVHCWLRRKESARHLEVGGFAMGLFLQLDVSAVDVDVSVAAVAESLASLVSWEMCQPFGSYLIRRKRLLLVCISILQPYISSTNCPHTAIIPDIKRPIIGH